MLGFDAREGISATLLCRPGSPVHAFTAGLWHETPWDVHPVGLGESRDRPDSFSLQTTPFHVVGSRLMCYCMMQIPSQAAFTSQNSEDDRCSNSKAIGPMPAYNLDFRTRLTSYELHDAVLSDYGR